MPSRHTVGALVAIIIGILTAIFSLSSSPAPALQAQVSAPTSTVQGLASAAAPTLPQYEWHKVVRAVDGDTLVIEIAGKEERVRLMGLDTPETVDPRKAVQCFGREASEKMKQLVGVGFVRIETDPSQGERDKYGRVLAYAYVPADSRPEGIMVNLYMIREGYGHEYTYNLPYKYQAEFQEAERNAREEKKGLWADAACAQESAR